MIFWILVIITVGTALILAGLELNDMVKGNKGRFSGKSMWHALGVFSVVASVLGLISIIIFMLAVTFVTGGEGDKQETIRKETLQIASNSDMETSGYFTFVSIDEKGNLTPQEIPYDNLKLESLNGDKVYVQQDEHTYTWVAPFPLKDITTITVK